jgi:hypothetical protein
MSTFKFVKEQGFGSIINYVNTGKEGTVDNGRLNQILKHMADNGWKEVIKTKENVSSIKPSTQIRYLIEDENGVKFRTGGFFVKFYDQDDDPNLTDSYILYATHVPGVNRTLQYEGFTNMYMKERVRKVKVIKENVKNVENVKKEKKNIDNRVKFKIPNKKTNFPTYLKNNNGEDIVVYYSQDNYSRNKFQNSKKYLKALEKGWTFKN